MSILLKGITLILSFLLLTGCSSNAVSGSGAAAATPTPVPTAIPADAIWPVLSDTDANEPSSMIQLGDKTIFIPKGYVYGKVESDGYSTYYVWQDKAEREYIVPTDPDVMLYIYEGLDASSPHAEITDSQALISMKSAYMGYFRTLMSGWLSIDPSVRYSDGEEYYTTTFTGFSGDYLTTTYSVMCYPKTYYGLYFLQKTTSTYDRRWYGFVFSNDAEGEIFTEIEYRYLLTEIKNLFNTSKFYSSMQSSFNYDPMKDVENGRSYEQMLDLFDETYLYYVETIGKPYERENVDAGTFVPLVAEEGEIELIVRKKWSYEGPIKRFYR